MIANIVVERKLTDLETDRWSFMISDHHVVPVSYKRITRLSRRSKFRTIARWDRYDQRKSNLSASDVPFPESVAREALERARTLFVVEFPTWTWA